MSREEPSRKKAGRNTVFMPPSRRTEHPAKPNGTPRGRTARFVVLAVYCLFLFVSGAYLYQIVRWVQSIGLEWIFPWVTLAFLGMTIVLLGTQIVRALSRKRYSHLLFLGIVLLSFFPAYFNIDRPLERFHFLEYSVLGGMIFRALASGKYSLRFYLVSLNLLLLVSYCDEVIQGFVSGRYYDIRDIWINIFSGAIGLLVLRMADLNHPLPLHPALKPEHAGSTRKPPLVDLHIFWTDLLLLLPLACILLFNFQITRPRHSGDLPGVWLNGSAPGSRLRFEAGERAWAELPDCSARFSYALGGNALDGYYVALIRDNENEKTDTIPCREAYTKNFHIRRDAAGRIFLFREDLGSFTLEGEGAGPTDPVGSLR
jgi:hypothetical protein